MICIFVKPLCIMKDLEGFYKAQIFEKEAVPKTFRLN